METRLSLVFLKNTMRTWSPSMFLLIGKILSLSFVNITMEIMSLLYYLLNRGIMSLETMSPWAMGIRTYSLLPWYIKLKFLHHMSSKSFGHMTHHIKRIIFSWPPFIIFILALFPSGGCHNSNPLHNKNYLCSKKCRMRTFYLHSEIISDFFVNQWIN